MFNSVRGTLWEARRKTTSRMSTGVMRVTYRCSRGGIDFENTMMKVSRYSASGITHNSGIDTMSVVTSVVVASMRLDGTAARNSQRSLVVQCGTGSAAAAGGA